jgi:hypothetical protein
MSVPAPQEPRQGGRWETIRYALDNNPRTLRLCLILSVAAAAPYLAILAAELVRHMMLCAAGAGRRAEERRQLVALPGVQPALHRHQPGPPGHKVPAMIRA